MKDTPLWKTFFVVFVVVFVVNATVVYLWDIFFHDSSFQWDATTTTAIVIAFVMSYIFHLRK